MSDAKPIIIFTDGACSGNPGPGGWAAILLSPLGKVRELGGREEQTTNNRMEMNAALQALLALAQVKNLSTKKVRVYTDSVYLIRGITEWVHGWKKRGWQTAEGKDVSNRDLWEALAEAIRPFSIDWQYVPGHMGFPGNERCDEIAVGFSKKLPVQLFAGAASDYRIDLSRVPKGGPFPQKKGPKVILYLSLVDGEVFRDRDWKSCEARVRGVRGAKYRKVESEEEASAVLREWGK